MILTVIPVFFEFILKVGYQALRFQQCKIIGLYISRPYEKEIVVVGEEATALRGLNAAYRLFTYPTLAGTKPLISLCKQTKQVSLMSCVETGRVAILQVIIIRQKAHTVVKVVFKQDCFVY